MYDFTLILSQSVFSI